MEFFIPGLSIFLLAIFITFVFSPKATPMLAAILSLLFLSYGVYDHYRMFLPEYRLSTWQQTLSVYSPFIMIGAVILLVIFSMISFFTGGAVPVVPSMEMPTFTTASNQLTKSLNTAVNSISNSANDLMESTAQTGNSFLNSLNQLNNSLNNSLGLSNSTKRNGNLSRSALETL